MEINRSEQAREFTKRWSKFDYKEKGNVGLFWADLLSHVYGISDTADYIEREKSIPNFEGTTDFIDVYIPTTKVLIEQKSPNVPLDKKEKRSFGMVTPFEQACKYNTALPWLQKARWIITCNFREFWVYDMNKSGKPKPTIIKLSDLARYYYQLDFLTDPTRQDIKREEKVSVKACSIITKIYHELLNQYNKKTPNVYQSINKVCVRLVFCLYADDSGIFGHHNMFHDYMKNVPSNLWRIALKQLFIVLNQPEAKRDSQLNSDLAQFPYVNGGMFADNPKHPVLMPRFNNEVKKLIINKAGEDFDWSQISPTIFGSLFESTLNPKERHTNGMHYTSVQNIHKVIDPLFLNDLRHQLNVIKTKYKTQNAITKNAKKFQDKLASLTFFDPACGSGNFLTETYLCLRKLENEAIKLIMGKNGQIQTRLGLGQNLIKVSIHQFYGIEINDFAVSVAKTAMWIAESQMVQQTQNIINQSITFLPLKSNPNIIEANALEMNWTNLINPKDLDYIISNPPFVSEHKSKEQKSDMKKVLNGFKNIGQLDYVSAWYKKSADMMKSNHNIQTALVSTNSITQGQQVNLLWKPLIKNYGLHINFAYQSFYWSSSVTNNALVVCVIIGLSLKGKRHKILFDNKGNAHQVKNINPYLKDLPNIFISSRTNPLCKVPQIRKGSQPTDHGYLSKFNKEDVQSIIKGYPKSKALFRKIVGANEFLNNKERYCLWLDNISPSLWLKVPPVKDNVAKVKIFRKNSSKKATRKYADFPYLFQERRQPKEDYMIIPQITAQNRKYIPMGFVSKNIIINNKGLAISGASIYDFGILSSIVHRIWIKLTSGRYGPSFEYSPRLTYNTFPWPKISNKQKQEISKTAKRILKARNNHKDSSLADLYNPLAMPPDLLKAHQANDKMVLKAYGMKSDASKNEIITKLLKMYQELVKGAKHE